MAGVALRAAAVAVLPLGACTSSTGAGRAATTSLPAVLGSEAPGTLPPTVPVATTPTPPPTAAITAAATTSSIPPSIPPSSAPSGPELSRPESWPVAGAVFGDRNASIIVYTDKVSVCVGVRVAPVGTRDACGDEGGVWSAVLSAADRLYVVGARRPDGHLVVEGTTGSYDVAPLAAGAAAQRPFAIAALALPPGADVKSLDGGDETTMCSYRSLLAALAASGEVGDAPVPLHIDQCTPSAASAVLLGSSRALQGAGALFDRGPDGQWDVVNVGGNLCGDQGGIDPATLTSDQQAALARTAAVCRELGR